MRDDDLAFVELVQRELRDVRWPEPDEIRARARRRSWRTAVLAAVAVLAVASGSAVTAWARPGPPAAPFTTMASPTSSPSERVAAEVPLEVLLAPADLRTDAEALTQSGLAERVEIARGLLWCHRFQRMTAQWEPSRYSRSVTLLSARPAGTDQSAKEVLLTQDVYRVEPDVARRLFAGIDKMLAPCGNWRTEGPVQWQGKEVSAQVTHRWQVVDRSFAGTESVLLRHSIGQARDLGTGRSLGALPAPESTAVVRVGDLVAVINLGRDGTESDLRRLATVAAARMCPAANPRC
ncbi:hypothetical protein ABZ570_14360 [Micromonospora sp. NPDC007271]|uniref:hypothetical protein n=1 Tax=Micromonospora sp. NPDC007271 TaxID=3154587 RepID=UPI0033E21F64